MIREVIQGGEGLVFFGEEELAVNNERHLWRVMERPELSLGPLSSFADGTTVNSLSPESEVSSCRKRKSSWEEPLSQTGIELQLKDPLPLDWEQCLDLQSGKMYYLNRKTLKRSWDFPKDRTLDLKLNISPPLSSGESISPNILESSADQSYFPSSMVAVACVKCHLLVMLCRSSPSCPNCKYVHSLLPPAQQPLVSKADSAPRSLQTLSLLH